MPRPLWFRLPHIGLAAALSVAASGAVAGTVTSYVVVQPIDVCSSTGANCAPINGSLNSSATNPGTTKIGFIDPTTGVDVTRAMLNQVGVDVTWNPVVQYNSAANPVSGTDYDTLTITNLAATPTCTFTGTGTGLTSCDFLTLSQQPSISQGIVPKTTTPRGVPVSSNPTTINMFFVNTINPPPGQSGILYGFSWINNNGVAISKNTFAPPFGAAPRFDTIAHEILHNLALTHTDFGAGPSNNIETAGDLRTQASASGCANPGGALFDLLSGTVSCSFAVADLPTLTAAGSKDCTSLTSTSPVCTQQGAAHLSNLLNPVQTMTTTGGTTSTCKKNCTTASTNSGPSPFDSISGNCNANVRFTITYPGDSSGRPNEYLADLDFMLPPGLRFVSGSFKPGNTSAQQDVAKTMVTQNGDLLIVLNKGTFPSSATISASFNFTVGVVDSSGSCASLTTSGLTGTKLEYVFSDGYSPTTVLDCSSGFTCTGGSQQVDLTTPSMIQNPDTFVGAGPQAGNNLACTPMLVEVGDQVFLECPDPTQTGVVDGDPSQEFQPSPPPPP